MKRRNRLSKMKINFVSLVDNGAHQDAHVVLAKRLSTEEDGGVIKKNTSTFNEHDTMGDRPTDEIGKEDMNRTTAPGDVAKRRRKITKDESTAVAEKTDVTTDSDEDEDDDTATALTDEQIDELPDDVKKYIERLEDLVVDVHAENAVLKAAAEDEDEDDEDDDSEEDDDESDDDTEDESEDDDEDDDEDDESEDSVEKMLKGVDPRLAKLVKRYVAESDKKADKAVAIAKRERDARLKQQFIAKADSLSALPIKKDDLVAIFKTIEDKVPELMAPLTKVLKAANGAVLESKVTGEIGDDTSGSTGESALAKFDKKVADIKTADPSLSPEQAFAKALDENPDLYTEYVTAPATSSK